MMNKKLLSAFSGASLDLTSLPPPVTGKPNEGVEVEIGRNVALGQVIRFLRGAESQESVAGRAGLCLSSWGRYERGRHYPREPARERIAAALRCHLADLEAMEARVRTGELMLDGRRLVRLSIKSEGGDDWGASVMFVMKIVQVVEGRNIEDPVIREAWRTFSAGLDSLRRVLCCLFVAIIFRES